MGKIVIYSLFFSNIFYRESLTWCRKSAGFPRDIKEFGKKLALLKGFDEETAVGAVFGAEKGPAPAPEEPKTPPLANQPARREFDADKLEEPSDEEIAKPSKYL